MSYLKTLLETESSAYCAHRSNMAAVLRSVCVCVFTITALKPPLAKRHIEKKDTTVQTVFF